MRNSPRIFLTLTLLVSAAVAFGLQGQTEGPPAREPRPDQPDKAMEFFLMKRLPEGRDIDLWERYRVAERHMETMPRYSSRLGTYVPSARQAQRQGLSKAGKLRSWQDLGPG